MPCSIAAPAPLLQTPNYRVGMYLASLVQFQQMGVAYVQFAVAHATHYRLMFHSDATWHTTYPSLNTTAKAVFALLVNSIVICQTQHKIKTGDPRALAHVVWALIHGLASLLIGGQLPSVTDVDGVATLATQTLITGLLPAPPYS